MAGVAAADDRLVRLLQRHEGLRLVPYRDTTGHLTIGYGLNLDAGISKAEAEWLLRTRVMAATEAVARSLPWWARLDEVRRSVLVDMAYNLGIAGLLKFRRTLAAIERGDYDAAARGMLASLWARQVGQRAVRLATMMRTGEWPAEVR